MAGAKTNNGTNGRMALNIAIYLISGFVGGGSGVYFYFDRVGPSQLQTIARPDPFTGSQGLDLQRRLREHEDRISILQRQVDQLPPREVTEQLALLQREVELLRKDLEAHESNGSLSHQ